MTEPSSFELAGREKKAVKLLAALEARHGGELLDSDAARYARLVARWATVDWLALAGEAGTKEPSSLTRDRVFEMLRERSTLDCVFCEDSGVLLGEFCECDLGHHLSLEHDNGKVNWDVVEARLRKEREAESEHVARMDGPMAEALHRAGMLEDPDGSR